MPIYLSVLGACAAKRYGVAARSIRGWKKQEAQLKSISGKCKRLKGGGKETKHPQEELMVACWACNK